MTNIIEFERESYRIDQAIWDAMALMAGDSVLFCGYANCQAWVGRAREIGVDVTVLETDDRRIAALEAQGIPVLRASSTNLPNRDASFDAVIAFHYLHEIDPTFHMQAIFELGRVGKRLIVVEPGPPTDPLGQRIAELYSRAKFEAGAFEEYQPIEYWRKLVAIVKTEVNLERFVFARIAPRFLIEESIDLVIDAMAVADLPQDYISELRSLAASDRSLLAPPARYVLVGTESSEHQRQTAGTLFRPNTALAESPSPRPATVAVQSAPSIAVRQEAEFPPLLSPDGEEIAPQIPLASLVPPIGSSGAIGELTPPTLSVANDHSASPSAFGTPFALPEDPDPFGLESDPNLRPGFGWSWEPPEGPNEE